MNALLPPPGDVALDDGARRAAVLVGGTAARIYDLIAGERLAEHQVGGPWIDLSPSGRWLATTEGAIRDALTGEVIWRGPFSGMPRFVDDDRVLLLRRGTATLWGWRGGLPLAEIDDERLDPTASARAVFGPDGLVAIADPAGDRLALLSLNEVRALPLEEDEPTPDAAFHDGDLLVVQRGTLSRVALPHGDASVVAGLTGQILSVAARRGRAACTSLAADGAYLFHDLDAPGAPVALPGRAPPSPALIATDDGWLVELWSGAAVVDGRGIRHQLRLPLGKDGARLFTGGRTLAAAGTRALIACQPPLAPYVYRVSDLTFERRLELEPERD